MSNAIIPSFYFSNKFSNYKDMIQQYNVQRVNFTGASRAQIERTLKELRASKIIETSRNKITILNLEQLLTYCSENVRNS